MESRNIKCWVDGACDNNSPGRVMGIGVKIDVDGTNVLNLSDQVGQGTNNIAEYEALLRCLEVLPNYLSEQVKASITIHSDSQLIVNQFNGVWACADPTLARYLEICKSYAAKIPIPFLLVWIPREENTGADVLSKEPLVEIRAQEKEAKAVEKTTPLVPKRPRKSSRKK